MAQCRLSIGRAWVVLSLCLPGVAWCAPADLPPDPQLDAAEELGSRDPGAARAVLADLRERALVAGDTVRRLRVDEADCRLLNESDSAQARRVAEAALAAVRDPLQRPAERVAAWRLRVCAAAALLDLGRTEDGQRELERILDETRPDADGKAATAIALLERGMQRSRRGDLLAGEADLLEACSTLETLPLARDLELCQWHLGNHYRRMGETEEALRLFGPLLDSARRREAVADASIYLLGIAQLHVERQAWEPALKAHQESAALAASVSDASGLAYAEHGIGQSLFHLGRPAEALPHAERARRLLADGSDPAQALRSRLLHANLLDALDRPADALAELEDGQAELGTLQDGLLESDWLGRRAAIEARLGRWPQAYASLARARGLDQRVHDQRLSQQQARLRMQFHRERDAAELQALRRVNEQGERLRTVQAVALALFVALLGGASWVATAKLRESRRLRVLATVDELTGLPNRRAVMARLESELRQARRTGRALAVLVIDIDHFKRVNDTHGHGVGDEALRHVARLLAGSLRSHDGIGRVGGEEFLVVLPETSAEPAQAIADRMRQIVARAPCPHAGGTLPLTISIGAAVLGPAPESPEQCIERADAALYSAKVSGRNRVCVAAELQPA